MPIFVLKGGRAMRRALISLVILAGLTGPRVLGQGNAPSFAGAGISGYLTNKPEPAGWFVYGLQISATQKIYTFIESDYIYVRDTHQIQSSARSGIGTYLRNYGPISLYVLGDAGGATTGSSSGAAFGGNMLVTFPLSKGGSILGVVSYKVVQTSVGGTARQLNIGIVKRSQ